MPEKFHCGDRVCVADTTPVFDSYGGKYVGCLGTVDKTYCSTDGKRRVAVILDDHTNQRSAYGYFYFDEWELSHVNAKKKTEEMKMHKMKNYLSVAEISFVEGSNPTVVYRYACYDPDVKVGDICVVASAHHGLGVAKVVNLLPPSDEELYREIVGRVDASAYRARVENRQLAAETEAAMKKMSEKLQTISLYEAMAKYSPEMAELLEKYKALPET